MSEASVEDRIIAKSLSMIEKGVKSKSKAQNGDMVLKVFQLFAIFPEGAQPFQAHTPARTTRMLT